MLRYTTDKSNKFLNSWVKSTGRKPLMSCLLVNFCVYTMSHMVCIIQNMVFIIHRVYNIWQLLSSQYMATFVCIICGTQPCRGGGGGAPGQRNWTVFCEQLRQVNRANTFDMASCSQILCVSSQPLFRGEGGAPGRSRPWTASRQTAPPLLTCCL